MKGFYFAMATGHSLLTVFNVANDQVAPFIFTACCAAFFVAVAVNTK